VATGVARWSRSLLVFPDHAREGVRRRRSTEAAAMMGIDVNRVIATRSSSARFWRARRAWCSG
jgi:hypothetical protein